MDPETLTIVSKEKETPLIVSNEKETLMIVSKDKEGDNVDKEGNRSNSPELLAIEYINVII